MEYIDLGLNDVGLHGEEKYKKESMNALFYKSIRKLMEDPSGLSCPQVLRMDNCGLGPPFCRSIGKVSVLKQRIVLSCVMFHVSGIY